MKKTLKQILNFLKMTWTKAEEFQIYYQLKELVSKVWEKNKIKGEQIGYHIQWLIDGEKASKTFYKLETRNYIEKKHQKVAKKQMANMFMNKGVATPHIELLPKFMWKEG